MSNFQSGEFQLESLTIVNSEKESVDLSTDLAINLRLYESIYSKFITGDVSVLDGLNLLKNFKFTGQESLTIRMRQKEGVTDLSSNEFSIEKTFRIYKVVNIQRPLNNTLTYQLKFCDPRMFSARTTRISQTLRGSYTDMLYQVLQDPKGVNIKPNEIESWEETSPDKMQFICPNWSVAELTDHIVSEASVGGGEQSWKNGMFFFQTINGGFRFTSIDTMFSMEFPLVFSYKPRNANIETKDLDINDYSGLNTEIMHVEKPAQFDTLRGVMNGAYASSMKVYDPIRKLESDIVYDMDETFKRGQHVSGFPLIRTNIEEQTNTADVLKDDFTPADSKEFTNHLSMNKAFESVVYYDYSNAHDFDNAINLSDNETFQADVIRDNAVLERKGLLETLQQHRIVVTIPLRTDLTVGQIIRLNIPEPESQQSKQSTKDNLNDNRYLIIDLCINADPIHNRGVCYLECVKESYAMDIESAEVTETSPRSI